MWAVATPTQQRDATVLSLENPPSSSTLVVPACGAAHCALDTFITVVRDAIDLGCVESALAEVRCEARLPVHSVRILLTIFVSISLTSWTRTGVHARRRRARAAAGRRCGRKDCRGSSEGSGSHRRRRPPCPRAGMHPRWGTRCRSRRRRRGAPAARGATQLFAFGGRDAAPRYTGVQRNGRIALPSRYLGLRKFDKQFECNARAVPCPRCTQSQYPEALLKRFSGYLLLVLPRGTSSAAVIRFACDLEDFVTQVPQCCAYQLNPSRGRSRVSAACAETTSCTSCKF